MILAKPYQKEQEEKLFLNKKVLQLYAKPSYNKTEHERILAKPVAKRATKPSSKGIKKNYYSSNYS